MRSKKSMNKSTITALGGSVFTLLFLVTGCGVKPREAPTSLKAGSGVSAFHGEIFESGSQVFISDQGRFLLVPSFKNLKANAINRVSYCLWTGTFDPRTSDLNLRALDFSAYTITVLYDMPDMPSMKIAPAAIRFPKAGQVDVKMNVSMDGWWRIRLTIIKNGAVVDTFTQGYNVPPS